jgi:hypothetical protein
MRQDEYEALPDEIELTCQYCGHSEEHSAFTSAAQRAGVLAAAKGIARQYAHEEINNMLGRTFGRRSRPRRSGSFISIETSYKPGSPAPVKALPDIIESRGSRRSTCARAQRLPSGPETAWPRRASSVAATAGRRPAPRRNRADTRRRGAGSVGAA